MFVEWISLSLKGVLESNDVVSSVDQLLEFTSPKSSQTNITQEEDQESTATSSGYNTMAHNLVVIFSQLYNFHVIHSDLISDILMVILENESISSLFMKTELVLLMISHIVPKKLRKEMSDTPLKLLNTLSTKLLNEMESDVISSHDSIKIEVFMQKIAEIGHLEHVLNELLPSRISKSEEEVKQGSKKKKKKSRKNSSAKNELELDRMFRLNEDMISQLLKVIASYKVQFTKEMKRRRVIKDSGIVFLILINVFLLFLS